MSVNFDQAPILFFWETTKACRLACRHCRAEAIAEAQPGQLSTEEGLKLIEDLRAFTPRLPVVIFTGGDPFMRSDLFELAERARSYGMPIGFAPSVTPLLTEDAARRMRGVDGLATGSQFPIPFLHTPSHLGGWVRDPLRRVSALLGPDHQASGFRNVPRASPDGDRERVRGVLRDRHDRRRPGLGLPGSLSPRQITLMLLVAAPSPEKAGAVVVEASGGRAGVLGVLPEDRLTHVMQESRPPEG